MTTEEKRNKIIEMIQIIEEEEAIDCLYDIAETAYTDHLEKEVRKCFYEIDEAMAKKGYVIFLDNELFDADSAYINIRREEDL